MDPTIFIAVTSAAVVLQALIMVALYLAVRKAIAKIEGLSEEVRDKVLPPVVLAHAMLVDMRPKVETVIENLSESTTRIRAQVERLDATLTDAVERARLQVIRADEMVGHTMDRIEHTRDIVHSTVEKAVVSPVRQISGLVRGVSTGFEVFFGAKRRGRNGTGSAQDEMFI